MELACRRFPCFSLCGKRSEVRCLFPFYDELTELGPQSTLRTIQPRPNPGIRPVSSVCSAFAMRCVGTVQANRHLLCYIPHMDGATVSCDICLIISFSIPPPPPLFLFSPAPPLMYLPPPHRTVPGLVTLPRLGFELPNPRVFPFAWIINLRATSTLDDTPDHFYVWITINTTTASHRAALFLSLGLIVDGFLYPAICPPL